MKILHQNAASLLLEKVKSLGPRANNSWRCIYLKLSDQPERYNTGLRMHFVAKALIDLLGDADGYMYLCDDGDIFILFQGPLKPVLNKLAGHFEEIDLEMFGEQPADGRFTIFDLSAYWQPLFELCRTKLPEQPSMH